MRTLGTKKNEIGTFLAITCFLCNISQVPQLMGNTFVRLLYLGAWLALFFLLCLQNEKIHFGAIAPIIIFDIICVIFQTLNLLENNGKNYFKSNLFQPIHLCGFILIIGIMCGKSLTHKDFQKVSVAFIASSLIVALVIYLNVFRGIDWASEGEYLYSSKNSAGQIFLTSIILVIYMFYERYKFLSLLISTFLMLLIFMMKSRATIISALIILLYVIFFIVKNPKKKLFLIFLFSIVVCFVFINPTLHKLFIEEIMLRNKELTDITGVTSNRDLHIQYFSRKFPKYWLLGTGGTYIEAFPLAGLLSYGVVGFIPMFVFSIYPILVAMKYRKVPHLRLFTSIVVILNLMMWFNGIFEELSPFGPGVKCYFLWLVTGILLSKAKQQNNEEDSNDVRL